MQEFKTESKKILDLVINSIYSTKEVFLRELISNASDSLDKVSLALSEQGKNPADCDLAINLDFDMEAGTITVSDNGIGMSAEQLETDLGTIAHSSSLALKRAEAVKDDENVDIIGQFGVGFYSSFMVADEVTVISRAFGTSDAEEANVWRSDGIEGFSIEPTERATHGTDVILHLRPNDAATDYTKFLSYPALEELVKRYSNYIRYPIYLETTGVEQVGTTKTGEPIFEEYSEKRVLNAMIPIWAKPRNEVTQQEYDSFYCEEFQDPKPPLRTITMHARGSHNCDVLLYIPSEPTGDFYSRDFQKGLELYSSGVLIDERNPDLIPEYFGFVRGVVDSPDVTLNLSREGLQEDPFLMDISKQIDKRLKYELDIMRDEEREAYVEFYSNFGRTFKFAIYATLGALNEDLEDYLMFYTALKDEPVTLREYRTSMPNNQPCILFASGDEAGKLESSPSVKAVTDMGFDVLLCSENIDEFALMTLRSYDNIAIKNVAADDLVLDNPEQLARKQEADDEYTELFAFINDVLPEDIVEVAATALLSVEPACITSKGPVSLGMEKYFASTPEDSALPPIRHGFELNPDHPIFKVMVDAFTAGDKDKVARYSKVLYGQAMLAEGLEIKDLPAYSQAVYELMA